MASSKSVANSADFVNHYKIEKLKVNIDAFTRTNCQPKIEYKKSKAECPRRIHIKVRVDELVDVQALLDSGAERMVIGKDVIDAINKIRKDDRKVPKLLKEGNESIVGFNGNNGGTKPKVTIIQLQWGKCISYERAIYEPKAKGLILDMDYLRFTKPLIDWDKREATTKLSGIFVSKACDTEIPYIDTIKISPGPGPLQEHPKPATPRKREPAQSKTIKQRK